MGLVLVVVALIGGIVVFANLYEARRFNNRIALNGLYLLLSVMMMLAGGIVLLVAIGDSATTPGLSVTIPLPQAQGIFLLGIISGFISISLIFSRPTRQFIRQHIVRSEGIFKRNHPDSTVHTLAIILMLLASVITIANFTLAGGIEGLSEELADISITDLLANFVIYLSLACLGVGIFIRRDLARTLRRLGIHMPDENNLSSWLRDGIMNLAIGAIIGFGMFWIQIGLSLIWQFSVPPETIAEQSAASQAIFEAFSGSLWLGFTLALTAGVGEELLFRGALQPIFGNLIVSIFFVMMHSQYILTPASLIIFLVSIVFGFVREHYSTPSAMMAHFIYNFTPFVLIAIINASGIPFDSLTF